MATVDHVCVLPFFVYECIPNCPSCFLILCSEHRRCVQSTGCPADTRPGSKRSSSGPCLACFVSSQHMAGLRGTGWPSAHTRDICNGRSYFLNIHVIFRCLSNHTGGFFDCRSSISRCSAIHTAAAELRTCHSLQTARHSSPQATVMVLLSVYLSSKAHGHSDMLPCCEQ